MPAKSKRGKSRAKRMDVYDVRFTCPELARSKDRLDYSTGVFAYHGAGGWVQAVERAMKKFGREQRHYSAAHGVRVITISLASDRADEIEFDD
jgi:hypothetical protein